jgi:hypothetical protein
LEEDPLNRCATVPGAGHTSVMPRNGVVSAGFALSVFAPPDGLEPDRPAGLDADSPVALPTGGATRSTWPSSMRLALSRLFQRIKSLTL